MPKKGVFPDFANCMSNSNLPKNRLQVTTSIFDRLLDDDPKSSREPPTASHVALRELKASVQRDLEWLLNTRQSVIDVPETLEEVNKSVMVYGLPDLTGLNVENASEQGRLVRSVERALKIFDPRFKNPKVFLEPVSPTDREVRFRIEAVLDIDPAPERVVFDTVLQAGSGDFKVSERT